MQVYGIIYVKHSREPNVRRNLINCVKRVHHYLKQGSKLLGTSTARFCSNLLGNRKSLWHFLKNCNIQSTNNLAERNLRHALLWRKKTFGKRSRRGNRFIERMLMVMMTAKQTDENIIQSVFNQLKLNKEIWTLQ